MPKWLEKIEGGMRRGGVDNPYALMNSMGIKRGSETVVSKEGAQRRMSSYARGSRRRRISAQDAGDKLAQGRK